MPQPRELHVDRWLTNVALDWSQDESNFVYNRVFPTVPVSSMSNKFVIFDRGEWWRQGEVHPRPLGGEADAVEWDKSEGTYLCEERVLAHRIDDRERANTDSPIRQDRNATKLLTERMMLDNEARWSSTYFTSGVWDIEEDGVASGPGTDEFLQFDQDGSDPVGVIKRLRRDFRREVARNPNRMVVGTKVNDDLEEHSDIKDRIKYTQTAIVTQDLLARLFGVGQYLVANAVENTAAEGQTDSFDFALNEQHALLAFAPDSPSIETPSAGYVFAWTNLRDGAANREGTAIMRGRDDFKHSDFFEIGSATDINLVSSALGLFLNTAVGA